MRKILLLLIFLFFTSRIHGQTLTARDAAVELSAIIKISPSRITLKWPASNNADYYRIYRKLKTDNNWGNPIANLSGISIYYNDSDNIIPGKQYEYKVEKSITWSSAGVGYICAGVNIPLVEKRGKMILLVDSTHVGYLAMELRRLEDDIIGDGWDLVRYNISPDKPVIYVKQIIKNEYNADSTNVKGVFIFGHIAVPYSGNIFPDGHKDHEGAWPADVFYGEMNGVWTDNTVNNNNAALDLNRNIPGDGKYDQSFLPSDLELQVGRVDLSNMPSLNLTERDLLKLYLDKDHDFRHKNFTVQRRGLIDSNFGYLYGEAFDSSGWRNFAPMFGPNEIDPLDYFTNLRTQSYLWAEGDGGGSYTSCAGIGSTEDFNNPVNAVFNILYGSYFTDWNSTNNFLRAPLASPGYTLTSVSSGRPHCQFHHMALGENIGYSIKLSQNNKIYSYNSNYYNRGIHTALMGDPSLRLHPLAPVSNLQLNLMNGLVDLSWTASKDSVLGYHVYRSTDVKGPFVRINKDLILGKSFKDLDPIKGNNTYMVRAVNLESSASGTYFNMSQGIFNSIYNSTETGLQEMLAQETIIYPNPSSGIFYLRFKSGYTGKILLEIQNSLGMFIKEIEIAKNMEALEYPLMLDEVVSGLYILHIRTEKENFATSLIKY